jgi:XTP/dITP diphosphohydrolase
VKIVVVTRNRNKASEIAAFFGKHAEIEHINMDLPEIRHDDVGEIARKKAEYAYGLIGRSLIVDDTAFSIEALRGFPGPCAAFVHDTIGNPGILKLMEGVTDRRAYFETAIALATDAGIQVFRGRIEGMIVPPRGSTGFGYDPIFETGGRTLAERSLEEKNSISHRAVALTEVKRWIICQDKTVKW